MARIVDIEGIGSHYAEKLKEAGIDTTDELLEAGASYNDRKKLSEKTGISTSLILEWVNRADLFRIKGVGTQYSDLLEHAGVDTVVELARRNPENLHAKILEVNEAKNLVDDTPSVELLKDWISQAKDLPRKVE